MGYRSDVTSLIYGTEDAIDALLARQMLETGTNCVKALEAAEVRRLQRKVTRYGPHPDYEPYTVTLTFLILEGQGWKWYDNYDDVKCWEHALRLVDEMGAEMDISFDFVRVGEETGDIDDRSGGSDPQSYARVRTSIDNVLTDETEEPAE